MSAGVCLQEQSCLSLGHDVRFEAIEKDPQQSKNTGFSYVLGHVRTIF